MPVVFGVMERTDSGFLITNTLEETTFPVRRTDPDTGEQEEGLAFLTIEGNTLTVAMQTRFVTEDGAFSVLGFTLPEWGFDCFPNSGAFNVNYAFNPQFADLNCDGRLNGADAIPVIAMQADVPQHIPAACTALGAPLPGDYTRPEISQRGTSIAAAILTWPTRSTCCTGLSMLVSRRRAARHRPMLRRERPRRLR
jgi:hypothetical protein